MLLIARVTTERSEVAITDLILQVSQLLKVELEELVDVA